MVWYFIGVYIINRTLHGLLEIRNFSSRVEKIFQQSKRNFVSPRGHVISSIYVYDLVDPIKVKGERGYKRKPFESFLNVSDI